MRHLPNQPINMDLLAVTNHQFIKDLKLTRRHASSGSLKPSVLPNRQHMKYQTDHKKLSKSIEYKVINGLEINTLKKKKPAQSKTLIKTPKRIRENRQFNTTWCSVKSSMHELKPVVPIPVILQR